jgi:hypothetical protein
MSIWSALCEETSKTHSGQMFSRSPKTILQIWPIAIFLQTVNMLHVQELCK